MNLPNLPAPILRALFDCEREADWASPEFGWTIWELKFGEAQYCPQWTEHKQAILRAWIADHPGTRPRIWWRLDAPEERPEGESEAAYLKRHRLFARGEERRLTPVDFEPVALEDA
jgi:hypothetical protein